jgi:hypothetical protein
VARVSIGLVVEYGGIKTSARWARTDPVSVGGGEAEVTARVIALEATVNDIVNALVSTGEGHLEVSLAGVRGARCVGDDEVLENCKRKFGDSKTELTYHAARVGGGVSIYHCTPDVEVLASTAI